MDPDAIVHEIDQMRVNRGMTTGELSRDVGRANGYWSDLVRRADAEKSSLLTLAATLRLLKIFGMTLYIGRIGDDDGAD